MPQNQENPENAKKDKEPMEILEDALILCKFGKFQIYMALLNLAGVSSMLFINITAFILPVSECDLKLNNIQKGFLGSAVYMGMLSTTIFVSFLSDTIGRKMFLVYGFIGQFFAFLIGASSQNFWTFAVSKLMEGVFMSLCFPGIIVIFSEVLHKNVKQRALLIRSGFYPFNLILLSLFSWAILPQKWDFVLIKGYFEIHSWNIYLYIQAFRNLMLGLVYYFFVPESPKFLLSNGQEDKALETLKYIYSVNTGNDKDSFPITTLNSKRQNIPVNQISFSKQLAEGMYKTKFLFRKPLFGILSKVSIIIFILFFSYAGLTVWNPQLTTVFENYQKEHNHTDRFCVVITKYTDSLREKEIIQNVTSTKILDKEAEICIPRMSGPDTYISGITKGSIALVGVAISTYLGYLIGVKMTLFILLLISSACLFSLYWVSSVTLIATMLSTATALVNLCISTQLNICMQVFPTNVRALGVSLIIMAGRIAAVLSGILFPVMLNYGCIVPFLVFCISVLSMSGLVYFLPFQDKASEGAM